MEAVVITLRANKVPDRRGKVLFINAIKDFARERAQSFLREIHRDKILNAYRAFTEQPGFATVADLESIAGNDYSLAMPLYVARPTDSSGSGRLDVDLESAVLDWRSAESAADIAIRHVISLLRMEAKS